LKNDEVIDFLTSPKTAKKFRGILYFAAPGRNLWCVSLGLYCTNVRLFTSAFYLCISK